MKTKSSEKIIVIISRALFLMKHIYFYILKISLFSVGCAKET